MRKIAVIVALLALMGVASAQPAEGQMKPVNPRTVEFAPEMTEYPQIVRFEIAYFLPGAVQPVVSAVSIGKPPVTATGCTLPNVDPCARATINTMPTPFGMDYTAKVRAVGVMEATEIFSEWSEPSNPFDRKPGSPAKPVVK